jgi:DNA-binding transcriptional regulator YhcF (GntR family)
MTNTPPNSVLSTRIADELRQAILSGELSPGERIRQEELAEQFGASRIPVREALRQSMPAYIVISEVNGLMPVIGTPVTGEPITALKRQHSDAAELAAAADAILTKIAAAKNPVATITALTARYGVADKAAKFVAKANLPVAITTYDKGVLDESLPQYIGLYNGPSSQPPEVRAIVEDADLRAGLTDLGRWSGLSVHSSIANFVRDGERATARLDLRHAFDVYPEQTLTYAIDLVRRRDGWVITAARVQEPPR